jgi:hypothetical protein
LLPVSFQVFPLERWASTQKAMFLGAFDEFISKLSAIFYLPVTQLLQRLPNIETSKFFGGRPWG